VRKNFALAAIAALMLAAGLGVHVGQVSAATAMPAVGQVAPGFTLPSQTGAQISLSSFDGKWVVLYFYPKDMTPGCTIEAHNFQAAQPQFLAKNAVILGVSVDSSDSHQQFCTTENLTFRLLADTKKKVTSAYGSLGANGMAARNTFLIDPQGKIAQVWTSVSPQTTVPIVLAAIPGGPVMVAPSEMAAPEVKRPITDSVKPPPPITDSVKPPPPGNQTPQ
jgi:peroxiredoxin Q/BCP